ncbi:uncharacterized protein PHACADRAFT_203145 [Phanerochaete carnosa HHB-10118-sp]|uniref:Uncharacterized protein n=1 Tax=Phanerochaete carnosa (strain HHB-10118-sp) TaxID=650164 RepID=K5VAS2_PHACS|nr:uncharacterized protein PHACADRAFT_203145 [Phanerochaete carnosa HHB-10118-sp]EKM48178.1 hypothetical protein PHACADRAFT_203145 [Phanerochaete carnosa HHB-10118-sp]
MRSSFIALFILAAIVGTLAAPPPRVGPFPNPNFRIGTVIRRKNDPLEPKDYEDFTVERKTDPFDPKDYEDFTVERRAATPTEVASLEMRASAHLCRMGLRSVNGGEGGNGGSGGSAVGGDGGKAAGGANGSSANGGNGGGFPTLDLDIISAD